MKKIFSFFLKIFIVLSICGIVFSWQNNFVYAADASIQTPNIAGADKFIINSSAIPQETISVQVDVKNPVVGFLSIIQKILLKLVLPIVAVGCWLYIAFVLFTADGDEGKMATAWKSILYSVIAIVSIGLSALIVDIIARLNIG